MGFDVYLNNEKIDTVFFDFPKGYSYEEMREDVRRSLIDHDGYPFNITVI